MGRFRLAVFDLDGTLIDSRPDIALALNAALAEYGLPPWSDDEVEAMVGEGARTLVERGVAGRLPPERLDEALARYSAHYAARPIERTRLYPGVVEGLGRLAPLGRAIATNKPAVLARRIVAEIGLAPLVDFTLGDGDVPRPKPDPAMITRAMERAGADRQSTLYVGDGPIDVLAARAAGVPLCLVSWGYRRGEPMAARPEYTAERFSDVVAIALGERGDTG